MAQSSRKGRLEAFIEKAEPVEQTLPFIHVTNIYKFDYISVEDTLRADKRQFLLEELVFLFYGRPAYRVKKTSTERLSFDWPVVLVLDERKIADRIYKLFPFDTGGFFIKKYEAFFDKSSRLEDFELAPNIETLKKIVGAFYRSNLEYFTGSSRKNVDIAVDEFEAAGLHEMARAPASPSAQSRFSSDERSSSIEVQLNADLPLWGVLKGIVLPEQYLDVEKWTRAINRWRPNSIATYSVINSPNPEFFAGMVYGKVEDLLRREGYLP